MKKFPLAALTAALIALSLAPAGASTRIVAPPSCEEPIPTREYDSEAMTYRLAMDLSACWWWDGRRIQLEASLSRLDGTGEEGSTTVVLCGGRVLGEDRSRSRDSQDDAAQGDAVENDPDGADENTGRQEEGDGYDPNSGGHVASASDDQRRQSSTCEVATALEHPSVEIARYRGEITFPWRDGPRTIGFTTYCASPGSVCRDG